jgi:hypothetical protein
MGYRHSIGVSDWHWDSFGGSPGRMRDVLSQYIAEHGTEAEQLLREATEPTVDPVDKGTRITVKYDSRCLRCGELQPQGTQVLYRVAEDGFNEFLCRDCAPQGWPTERSSKMGF